MRYTQSFSYPMAWISHTIANTFSTLTQSVGHWFNAQLSIPPNTITNKTFSELNYQDKDLWEGFFWVDIEVIQESLSADTNSTDLKESLEDLWGTVGRSTLAPEIYEDGLRDLKRFIANKKALRHLLPVLAQCKKAFRQHLIENQAFTCDCLLGDITQLLPRVANNKLSPNKFIKVLRYYSLLLTAANYQSTMQYLFNNVKNVETAFLTYSVYNKLQHFIQAEISFAYHHSDYFTKAYEQANINDQIFETVIEQNEEILSSNDSLLHLLINNIKTLGFFALEHSLEALTFGLALQVAAVSAISPIKTNPINKKSTRNTNLNLQNVQINNEFQVNTYTFQDQIDPALTVFPNGNFLIVWSRV